MAIIKPKRGTRAQLDAAAALGALTPEEICFITDENKLAMCTSTTDYNTYSPDSEPPLIIVSSTAPANPITNQLWLDIS